MVTETLHPIKRPPLDEAALREITRRIVEAFNPYRIILFGSRARATDDDESDIDLYVEMDSDEPKHVRRRRIDDVLQSCRRWPMDLIVLTPKEAAIERKMVSMLVPVIEKEGRVLFERPHPHVEVDMAEVPDEVQLWVQKAEEDRLAVRTLVSAAEVPWAVVCFHAQQAAEKYLKAFLVKHGVRPERTHNLTELLKECLKHDASLGSLSTECQELTQFAVDVRYPGVTEEFARNAAKSCVQFSDRICDLLRARLPQRGPAKST